MLNNEQFDFYRTGATHKSISSAMVELDTAVQAAPGMLSTGERKMLFHLASERYKGKGVIIDGGSFFGSSLFSSASGLKANPLYDELEFTKFPSSKPIHGYELGFLPAPKSAKVSRERNFRGVEYRLGDSFVPILESTISDHTDVIDLNVGDLLDESWDKTPIEICFIDVCKTIALNAHVSAQFYPRLISGESFLINQDFFFDRLPWIKVTMGYLEEYFEWCGQVSTSSIYKNVKAIPEEVASFDPYTNLGLDECLKLHDKYPFNFLDRRYTYYMELSKSYLMALKGKSDMALEYLDAVSVIYADQIEDKEVDRGGYFRLERARRQISNGNIFKVS